MAGLTKQHFKAIAEIVNKKIARLSNVVEDEVELDAMTEHFKDIVNDLSDYFKTQNPLFNENQFKKNCLK